LRCPLKPAKGIPHLTGDNIDALTRHVGKKLSKVFPTHKVEAILTPKVSIELDDHT